MNIDSDYCWDWLLLMTTDLARPKSATLTTVFFPTRQLRAARSRWMKPFASRYSIAEHTCHHVQFSSVQSLQLFSEEKSVKDQSGKMSPESWLKLIASDGRGVKVKWQWVPDNWSCNGEALPSKPIRWTNRSPRSAKRRPGRPELSTTVYAMLLK